MGCGLRRVPAARSGAQRGGSPARPRTRHFVFVSSGNVYADHRAPGQDESAPLLPALEGPVMESMASYGEAKVACEQHVLGTFGPDAA